MKIMAITGATAIMFITAKAPANIPPTNRKVEKSRIATA
jgi:hypothetical protein